MRLVCGICLSSQSDARAKGTDANGDWVAVTDCGHVYHASCLNQWTASKPADARMCPCKCTFRNVKCDKQRATANGAIARRSNMQEPMPLLKLFLTGTGAGAPSSDAVLASDDVNVDEEEDAKPPRKRLRPDGKGKGKARAVLDQEEDDSDLGEASPAAGPSNDLPRSGEMRRQWLEAMATVREQRAEIARLNATNSDLREQLEEATGGGSDEADDGNNDDECLYDRIEARRRGPFGAYGEDDEEFDRYDFREDSFFDGEDGECHCKKCNPEGSRSRLKERLNELETRLKNADMREQTFVSRTSELHAQIKRLQDEREDLLREFNALGNDHQTARVKWREAEKAYKIRLQQAGESGAAIIEQLRAEVAERDNEITHLKANIDGIKYHADKEMKKAQAAVASAQASASSQILQAIEGVKAAEARLTAEIQVSRRHAAANARLNASITRTRQKLNVLRSKRGTVGSDSDAEDATAAAPAPEPSSRTLKRTTSSRSNFSLSPPASPTDAVRINNNSTLLGNSPRKQRHSRSAFDDWDLSREEERPAARGGLSPTRRGSGVKEEHNEEEDDDELEYVDVTTGAPTAKPAPVTARSKPSSERVIELSDDDSEVDVVASSYFSGPGTRAGTKGPDKVAGRPSASAPSSTTSRKPPVAAAAAAAAEPFATLTNSVSGGAVHPLWKKAAAAAPNKQDKHLPDFSKGRVDTGAKRHVKRK